MVVVSIWFPAGPCAPKQVRGCDMITDLEIPLDRLPHLILSADPPLEALFWSRAASIALAEATENEQTSELT